MVMAMVTIKTRQAKDLEMITSDLVALSSFTLCPLRTNIITIIFFLICFISRLYRCHLGIKLVLEHQDLQMFRLKLNTNMSIFQVCEKQNSITITWVTI